LKVYGLDYCLRRIGEILANPFYCGKMVHKALEGEVVDGRHEKVVSEAIFLEANNIMAEKKLGLQTKQERPEIALKRFMKCAACNQPMRGYIANAWNVPYYKCNTPGCKCNRNANEVNNKFARILEGYKINDTYIPLIKEQLYVTFQEHNASLQKNEEAIICQLRDLHQKLERLEERFILEELTADLYQKYKGKFEKELEEIEAKKASNRIEMSKLEDYIAVSLEFACDLSKMWGLGDYTQRQELQKALFEAGIIYDRQKDECRCTEDNLFITEIAELSGNFSNFPTANNNKNKLTSVGAP
jgi:site-specific DNA recombinase